MQRIDFNKIKVPLNIEKGYSYDASTGINFSYEIEKKTLFYENDDLILCFLDKIYKDFSNGKQDVFVSIAMYRYYEEYYENVIDEICNYFNDKSITVIQGHILDECLNIICNSAKDTVFIFPTEYYRSDTERFVDDLISGNNNKRHCIFIFLDICCVEFDAERNKIKYYIENFEDIFSKNNEQ